MNLLLHVIYLNNVSKNFTQHFLFNFDLSGIRILEEDHVTNHRKIKMS